MEEDNSVDDVQEWYTYKIGDDKSFNKLGDVTSHPEQLRTSTHVRIEASAIARNAFFRFQALVAVDLLPGLQEIGDRAFQYCSNLQFVSMPSTLLVIGGRAFHACLSLKSVNIPKSTSIIRPGAFHHCTALKTVNLSENGSLEVLEDFLFSGCSALRMIHVPSSVKHIRQGAFFGCDRLVTIELAPIGILSLGKRCFKDANELSNMLLPPTVNSTENDLFAGAFTIRTAIWQPGLINPNEEDSDSDSEEEEDDEDTNNAIVDAMTKRFAGLPLHKLCYYHTYSPIETTLNQVQDHSQQQPQDYNQIDMFDMTPIHVLALSTEPNVRLFQELAKCVPPKMFTSTDDINKRPMNYLLEKISMPGAKESVRFLIQHTIADRSQKNLGLDRWKSEIADQIDGLDLEDLWSWRRIFISYNLLEKFEFIETTSLMEMALWKLRMDEAKKGAPSLLTNDDRMACRISCGADVVTRNVLRYLLICPRRSKEF